MSRHKLIQHLETLDFDDEALVSLAHETDSCFGTPKEINEDVLAVVEGRAGVDLYCDNDKFVREPTPQERGEKLARAREAARPRIQFNREKRAIERNALEVKFDTLMDTLNVMEISKTKNSWIYAEIETVLEKPLSTARFNQLLITLVEKRANPEIIKKVFDGKRGGINQDIHYYALNKAIENGDKNIFDVLNVNTHLDVSIRLLPAAFEGGMTDLSNEILDSIKSTKKTIYSNVMIKDAVLLAARQDDVSSFRTGMKKAEKLCSFLRGVEGKEALKKELFSTMNDSGSNPIRASLETEKEESLEIASILHHEYGFRISTYCNEEVRSTIKNAVPKPA